MGEHIAKASRTSSFHAFMKGELGQSPLGGIDEAVSLVEPLRRTRRIISSSVSHELSTSVSLFYSFR